ncbi:ABC transporter G member 14 [Asimina triloba]
MAGDETRDRQKLDSAAAAAMDLEQAPAKNAEQPRNATVVAYPQTQFNSRSILRLPLYPVTLKFEEVVYKVKEKQEIGMWSGCKSTSSGSGEKTILNGITGMVCPGEILAMLGPSGSGKTSLLTALGGRLCGKGKLLSGKITYNGQPLSGSMKRRIGFVGQDDVFYPHLTVAETLIFAALLRLPSSRLSEKEKVEHAEQVMMELGLGRCRNSMIGGPLFRGISGGEKKRVSIGQEMLVNPSVLLLDEPTSGLDSTTAQRIVRLVKGLASRGRRTVVMTIHQPSSRLYHMFDKVILLSQGSPIYHGQASTALDYFSSIGFPTSMSVNPADLLLDLAHGTKIFDLQLLTARGTAGIAPTSVQAADQEFNGGMEEEQKAVREALISAYDKNIATRLKAELCLLDVNYSFVREASTSELSPLLSSNCVPYKHVNLIASPVSTVQREDMILDEVEWKRSTFAANYNQIGHCKTENVARTEQWCTNWWQQFNVLLRRGLKERRHEAFNGLRIFQVLSVAFLAGLLWWHSPLSHIQDRIALLFFFSVFWGFFPLYNAVFTFPQERSMLIKERSSGMYRLSSYFLARTVGDLPMELALPTAFVVIIYWMGGLKADPAAFVLSLLVVLYSVLVSQSLGLAFGAILMEVKQATTLASVTTLVFLIAGGYYIQQIPPFIIWMKYLSFSFYCYKLLLGVQFTENDYYVCSKGVMCRVVDFPAVKSVGLNHVWMDVCIMGLMLVGYRLVAYLALHRVQVSKLICNLQEPKSNTQALSISMCVQVQLGIRHLDEIRCKGN